MKIARALVTVTGCSGAGKTTIVRNLTEEYPERFVEAISVTTRPPRKGEVNGVHYHFVTRDGYNDLHCSNKLIESISFNGNLYGLTFTEISTKIDAGYTVLFVAEPKGVEQIRCRCAGLSRTTTPVFPIYSVLVTAPVPVLERRMVRRGDDPSDVAARIVNDKVYFDQEFSFDYDVVIANDRSPQDASQALFDFLEAQ